jgi:phosphatidylserine/phosphatidylglycerophosphate/cardiolipin synthase-like enzyme
MRVLQENKRVRVRAISGTRVVLMVWDVAESGRTGLRGFAVKRGIDGGPQTWLTGLKYFKDTVPNPKAGDEYSTRDQPLQSFLWSDYTAEPGKKYDFTIVPLYGDPRSMQERDAVSFSIQTEPEFDGHHGVWFNRGAIASHAFETEFHNKALTKDMVDDVGEDGTVHDPEVVWLSRGLLEACLGFINSTKTGEGLRVCAYEFTYAPILDALKRALDRGVDVRIVYHDTKKPKDENRVAIGKAKLPQTVTRSGAKVQILFPRTRTKIPHNKFIVKLSGSKPAQVWTGSTNFTDSGFLGQTNVGHLVDDPGTAQIYLSFWSELSTDPTLSVAVENATKLTRNPPNVVQSATTEFFSPRKTDNMLDWYAERIGDAGRLVMMTIPFNVAPTILKGLEKVGPSMRFVILENPPSPDVLAAEKVNRGKLLFSNGALMNKNFVKNKAGGAKVTPIVNSPLDKWFVEEELDRPYNQGHVFFIHSKVLLIDPLSDDPLVCSGSANFSTGSLISNDENMLLIRGNTRVADIYMTELDRLFRHFYARDVINRLAKKDSDDPLLLDVSESWIDDNYRSGSYKNNRREMFFSGSDGANARWTANAAKDGDPFAEEDRRAADRRKKKRVGTSKKVKKKKAKT